MKTMIVKRVTTPFLQAIPQNVKEFDAFIYATVRSNIKDDYKIHLDPVVLKLSQGIIIVNIPYDLNNGIYTEEDLEDDWFESVQAAFLNLILRTLPR